MALVASEEHNELSSTKEGGVLPIDPSDVLPIDPSALLEGLEEDLMVALLDQVQRCAAVCAKVCSERLKAIQAQALLNNTNGTHEDVRKQRCSFDNENFRHEGGNRNGTGTKDVSKPQSPRGSPPGLARVYNVSDSSYGGYSAQNHTGCVDFFNLAEDVEEVSECQETESVDAVLDTAVEANSHKQLKLKQTSESQANSEGGGSKVVVERKAAPRRSILKTPLPPPSPPLDQSDRLKSKSDQSERFRIYSADAEVAVEQTIDPPKSVCRTAATSPPPSDQSAFADLALQLDAAAASLVTLEAMEAETVAESGSRVRESVTEPVPPSTAEISVPTASTASRGARKGSVKDILMGVVSEGAWDAWRPSTEKHESHERGTQRGSPSASSSNNQRVTLTKRPSTSSANTSLTKRPSTSTASTNNLDGQNIPTQGRRPTNRTVQLDSRRDSQRSARSDPDAQWRH